MVGDRELFASLLEVDAEPSPPTSTPVQLEEGKRTEYKLDFEHSLSIPLPNGVCVRVVLPAEDYIYVKYGDEGDVTLKIGESRNFGVRGELNAQYLGGRIVRLGYNAPPESVTPPLIRAATAHALSGRAGISGGDDNFHEEVDADEIMAECAMPSMSTADGRRLERNESTIFYLKSLVADLELYTGKQPIEGGILLAHLSVIDEDTVKIVHPHFSQKNITLRVGQERIFGRFDYVEEVEGDWRRNLQNISRQHFAVKVLSIGESGMVEVEIRDIESTNGIRAYSYFDQQQTQPIAQAYQPD
ncbi:hypothetical protein COV82_04840 [Candidatus Peregrinibacteria bacterium CG11_big_fil_rev_8_21_14_0_20_46_8]|nr:MAG: hypothetical protein COV82_04840 [Candidatus Peregrinibacteria bacterium CG11_big_fil_rev_8_21_14_0_20_46_8]